MVKRRTSAGDNQGFLPFLSISAATDPQPSGPPSGSDKPLAVRSVRPEDMDAEIQQLEQVLEAETRKFDKRVAKYRKRLAFLKRARAGRLAAKASAAARAPSDTAAIRRRWHELGGRHGLIPQLAKEFGCSVSTVQRRLGKRPNRMPTD